jgi:EAL domain-containing protein (putative c-di-GMP-specific phosphodiesterase class I)
VDTLKIDRAFISRIDTDPATHQIVRIIVMLAHGLHLKVVAEGVETQAQVDLLKDMGCELAQGYLYSKPAAVEDIQQLLSKNRVSVSAPRAKAATSTLA